MVHVRIDADRCQGHGRCYALSPDVFGADDLGHGEVLLAEADGEAADDARVAAANCPEEAVIVSETGDGT